MSSGTVDYDWSKVEEEILIDMIRADNFNRPLDMTMITFGLPEELTPTSLETYNTRVRISATQTAPFSGSQWHRYHRVDIANFVYVGVTSLQFVIQDYVNVEELLSELSDRLGVNLRSSSVVFAYPSEVGNHTLTISNASLCYYGTLELEFVDKIFDLIEVIPNSNMTGFTF